MKTLNINLGDRSYPIYIGHNLLNDKEIFQRHAKAKTIAIVTNDIVAPLYLNTKMSVFAFVSVVVGAVSDAKLNIAFHENV